MIANKRVLISGLGIAGPTLAYWLKKYGFEPTIVERAPSPRVGGYIIDFWGVGFDVAEKMGILPTLYREGYDLKLIKFVDSFGKEVSAVRADSFKRIMGTRYLSVLRSGLARVLYERIQGDVEVLFDDSIGGLEMDEKGARVRFERGSERTFDLVVGADGLHSTVRALAFGPESQFEKFYGFYAASYTVKNYPIQDYDAYISHTVPGKQIARYLLRNEETAAFFIFKHTDKLSCAPHDTVSQRKTLREVFAGVGWECPQLLDGMESATDFYFDAVSQIHMPHWSKDRVALIGDAAFCPSLLSGQGSAIAMAAAYVLAGELKEASGDYRGAFRAYENQMRKFADQKQASAQKFAGSFVPNSKFGIWIRNQGAHLMSIPAFADWFGRRFLTDPLELKAY